MALGNARAGDRRPISRSSIARATASTGRWRGSASPRRRRKSGQYDQAINTYKELAQRKDGPLPIDGILMQLGLTYRDAGKPADAQQTFNRLVEEFPDSPFSARREAGARHT